MYRSRTTISSNTRVEELVNCPLAIDRSRGQVGMFAGSRHQNPVPQDFTLRHGNVKNTHSSGEGGCSVEGASSAFSKDGVGTKHERQNCTSGEVMKAIRGRIRPKNSTKVGRNRYRKRGYEKTEGKKSQNKEANDLLKTSTVKGVT